MINKQITVPREWFDRLWELKKKVENNGVANHNSNWNFLMGYLDSIKTMLGEE